MFSVGRPLGGVASSRPCFPCARLHLRGWHGPDALVGPGDPSEAAFSTVAWSSVFCWTHPCWVSPYTRAWPVPVPVAIIVAHADAGRSSSAAGGVAVCARIGGWLWWLSTGFSRQLPGESLCACRSVVRCARFLCRRSIGRDRSRSFSCPGATWLWPICHVCVFVAGCRRLLATLENTGVGSSRGCEAQPSS